MRVIACNLTNFASYEKLNFYFDKQGLTLIQGPTGSGKSTLCDAIPWILFGKTAKGGAVDEVLSWPGDKITKGTLFLADAVIIVRKRGPSPKDNDLYFYNNDTAEIRGKDMLDTQKLINSLIGMDYDMYLAGSYFHEFSQTAQFFVTTAKNRRALCEQIVDLSLAKKLQVLISNKKKADSDELKQTKTQMYTLTANIDLLKRMLLAETVKHGAWAENQKKRKAILEHKYDNFESDKAKEIERLILMDKLTNTFTDDPEKCPTCGYLGSKPLPRPLPNNVYKDQINREKRKVNTYIEQLADLELETNPHDDAAKNTSLEIVQKETTQKELQTKIDKLTLTVDDLELLAQVTDDYRSVSIANTIKDVEAYTNQLLTNHFDSECKVEFEVADADKLDVTIYKDGNLATYFQLSKGQRGLLKLCFGVAVMRAVANHNGLSFNVAMFDESIEGFSDELKGKAYGLFETLSLEYGSVFVVDHSESFKALFNNSYNVRLVDGKSEIEKN